MFQASEAELRSLANDADGRVSSAASLALSRMDQERSGRSIAEPDPARLADLVHHDPDADVRVAALPISSASDEEIRALQAAAGNSDWRVRSAAGCMLADGGSEGLPRLAALLGREWDGVSSSEQGLAGPEMHVLLSWLQAIAGAARASRDPAPAVVPALLRIYQLSDVSDAAVTYRPAVRRGIDLAHCAAADALAAAGHPVPRPHECARDSGDAPAAAVPASLPPMPDPTPVYGHRVTALVVTDKGDIALDLAAGDAPEAVTELLLLGQEGRLRNLDVEPRLGASEDGALWIAGLAGGAPPRLPDRETYAKRGRIALERSEPERGMVRVGTSGPDAGRLSISYGMGRFDPRPAVVIGRVTGGMPVVDALEPGDRIHDIYMKVQ